MTILVNDKVSTVHASHCWYILVEIYMNKQFLEVISPNLFQTSLPTKLLDHCCVLLI